MGLRIDVTQVDRISSDGNTANEGTKTVSVGQARVIFDKLPETADEVKVIDRVVTRFAGADTERYVDFYMDPKDGNWYIWSDTYKSVLADIKTPM